MKKIVLVSLLFATFLCSSPAFADLAPAAPWEEECNVFEYDWAVEDCISDCYWYNVVHVYCELDSKTNAYQLQCRYPRHCHYIQMTREEIEAAEKSCNQLRQFGESLPSSLKSLKKLISSIVSVPQGNADLFSDMNTSQCSSPKLPVVCAMNHAVELCVQECHETEHCIKEYKRRHKFL